MANIRYEILSANHFPVTVWLEVGGVAVDANVHFVPEVGEFPDKTCAAYCLHFVDAEGCEWEDCVLDMPDLMTEWTVGEGDKSITLPLVNAGGATYNFTAYWGDGTSSAITAFNDPLRVHTYASAGTYTVRIHGTCEGWSFLNGGDKLKINRVWGGNGFVFKYLADAFYGCTNLTEFDCPDLDVSACTNFNALCYNCTSLSVIDVENWDTSLVTAMDYTFVNCTSLTTVNVDNWDVSSVTSFGWYFNGGMFARSTGITHLNLSNWTFSTSNTQIIGMFYGCTSLDTITGHAGFDTSHFTSMAYAFYECSSLTSLDVSLWDVSACTDMRALFGACTGLTTIAVDNWNISSVTNFGTSFGDGMFHGCTGLTSLNLEDWDFNLVSNISIGGFCANCTNLESIGVDFSGWDTSKFYILESMFYNCTKLDDTIDVSVWDTSNIINLSGTFYNCSSLTTLDVSAWDISNATNFTGTFWNCTNLDTLDVSGWTFSAVSNVSFISVFRNCSSLATLDVSAWNTNKFVSLAYAFKGSGITTLNVGGVGWDVSNITDFTESFSQCTSLLTLDVSSWTFSAVSNVTLSAIFSESTSLTNVGDLTGWITSKVTSMQASFYKVPITTLVTTGWNTSGITNFVDTFQLCTSLLTLDTSGFDTSAVTNCSRMFKGCNALTSAFDKDLWWCGDPAGGTFTECFTGAVSISNYAAIPTTWGGSYVGDPCTTTTTTMEVTTTTTTTV